ncbi:hypothetical protein BH23VER1_BH23VER1_30250 [soil metagenome]
MTAPPVSASPAPFARIGLAVLACISVLVGGTRVVAAEEAETPPPAVMSSSRVISQEDLKSIALDEPIVIADDLRITHMGTGILAVPDDEASAGDPTRFIPATKIPRTPDQAFGWAIRFDTTRDAIDLSEHFVLPSKTTFTFGGGEPSDFVVAEDGRSATSTLNFRDLWDWTFHLWNFEATDPLGDHRFDIYLDDKLIASLAFTVVMESE